VFYYYAIYSGSAILPQGVAAGGRQHRMQCRALDGSHSSSHFWRHLCCTALYRVRACQAGAVKASLSRSGGVFVLCDPVILLFRCRDVTDGFDTISNKGKVSTFSSGPSIPSRPSVFRSFSEPGPLPASVLCNLQLAHYTTN
jgi:hypothetical protein